LEINSNLYSKTQISNPTTPNKFIKRKEATTHNYRKTNSFLKVNIIDIESSALIDAIFRF